MELYTALDRKFIRIFTVLLSLAAAANVASLHCSVCVRSLEMASSTDADDEQPSSLPVAGYDDTTADELAPDCHAHSISSCFAGVRETLAADSSDVLAMPT